MKKKLVLAVCLSSLVFSCNDDDFIKEDYSKNIELRSGYIFSNSISQDHLIYRTNVVNSGDKDVRLSITFDIYREDLYFGEITINDVQAPKKSNTSQTNSFNFRHFNRDIYTPKNIRFVITYKK